MVFLSYAHTPLESALAGFVTRCLEAAGVDVWRDVDDLMAGDQFPEEIERQIARADHLIFLVTNTWLERKWCRRELHSAVKHHGKEPHRFLPIFRAAAEDLLFMPEAFEDTHGLFWMEDDAEPFRQLCELHMAIANTPIEPFERAEAGKRLAQKAGLTPPVAEDFPLISEDLPSFRCNRTHQWQTVEHVMTDLSDTRHDVIVVPGARGEAHDHFLMRIERQLAKLPDRRIVPVRWRQRPSSREEYLGELAESMGKSSVPLLREHLRALLQRKHVVLVHECLRGGFDDPHDLVEYYGTWLPELVGGAARTGALKCVQAVEWPRPSGGGVPVVGSLLRLLRRPSSDTDEISLAKRLVERLNAAGVSGTVATVCTDELQPITEDDVRRFCRDCGVPRELHDELVRTVMPAKGRTSEEILRAIDKFVRGRERRKHDDIYMEAV